MTYTYTQLPVTQVVYASWAHRVGSSLIDYAVVLLPLIAGTVLQVIASGANSSAGGFEVLGALGTIVIHVWNTYIRQGRTGQTIGKRVLHTRLVSLATGRPIGVGMALVRNICQAVDGALCYIGYLWPLWDARRQTLADKIVNTVVVLTE